MLWTQAICYYRMPSEPASLSSQSSKEPNLERQAKMRGEICKVRWLLTPLAMGSVLPNSFPVSGLLTTGFG